MSGKSEELEKIRKEIIRVANLRDDNRCYDYKFRGADCNFYQSSCDPSTYTELVDLINQEKQLEFELTTSRIGRFFLTNPWKTEKNPLLTYYKEKGWDARDCSKENVPPILRRPQQYPISDSDVHHRTDGGRMAQKEADAEKAARIASAKRVFEQKRNLEARENLETQAMQSRRGLEAEFDQEIAKLEGQKSSELAEIKTRLSASAPLQPTTSGPSTTGSPSNESEKGTEETPFQRVDTSSQSETPRGDASSGQQQQSQTAPARPPPKPAPKTSAPPKPSSPRSSKPSSPRSLKPKDEESENIQIIEKIKEKLTKLGERIHPSNLTPTVLSIIIVLIAAGSFFLIAWLAGMPPFHMRHATAGTNTPVKPENVPVVYPDGPLPANFATLIPA